MGTPLAFQDGGKVWREIRRGVPCQSPAMQNGRCRMHAVIRTHDHVEQTGSTANSQLKRKKNSDSSSVVAGQHPSFCSLILQPCMEFIARY